MLGMSPPLTTASTTIQCCSTHQMQNFFVVDDCCPMGLLERRIQKLEEYFEAVPMEEK
jgi:hypothetical protein